MKVIFKNRLWVVVGDDGEGVRLESLTEPVESAYASYSDESLIVDPTDGEVEALLRAPRPRIART